MHRPYFLLSLLFLRFSETCYLQIHFRGYPSNVLIPCEGEDSIKWNFVNSLKEVSGNFSKLVLFVLSLLSETLHAVTLYFTL